MKIFTKLLLVATMFLPALTANAAGFRFLSFGVGEPGVDEPGMMGMGISPDGRYVCGALQLGVGYFMGDLENNRFFYEISVDPEGADLRHVNNEGMAIGFDGPGVMVNIDGGRHELQVPDNTYRYVLGEALTNDGSIMVGSLVGSTFISIAAYCKEVGQWTPLPAIDDELLGVYKNKGTSAKYISGDGRVIGGYIGSGLGPATLWIMNDNGEYEADPFFTRYAKVTKEDPNTYAGFYIKGVSNNGKYVLIQGMSNAQPDRAVPMVYNTETKEMTVYDEPQTNFDDGDFGITPTAISDDGMFVGVVGQISINLGGFIMYPGETQAQMLCDAYPAAKKQFTNLDVYGYHVPMGLTADGRYLIGYGYYCEDPYNQELEPYFATYILDTTDHSGVSSVTADGEEDVIYNLQGMRVSGDNLPKGIYIINGKKVVK